MKMFPENKSGRSSERKFIFLMLVIFLFSAFAQKNSSGPRFDAREFAPGYPNYSVAQIDQLKSFPLPRYKPFSSLQRNFSWFDFMYMAYDYSKTVPGKDNHFIYPGWTGKDHAAAALEMNIEMYDHWHYYFNIPTPTYYYGNYSKPFTIAGAQAKYADQHPDVQTCTYLFWGGIRTKDAGYPSLKPFIKFNTNINPCTSDSSYRNIAKDGKTQRFYLSRLSAALPHRDSLRKVDFVNENGEVFGEAWTPNAEGYRGNELIKCIQPDSDNARAMRAKWQYKIFNKYKSQFIGNDSLSGFKDSYFSFYQVAGFLPEYYSEWSEMRYINSSFHNSYYSTPDFYPGQADHSIFQRYSFYHGLDCIQEGRKYEISKGDSYFSPFVAAGWFEDSLNYRPAQWLAATKALAMMGAEFYYPAFFNTGNPSLKVPIDPRGYIYQVAMPAYAQAITSRYEKIFFHSKDFTYVKKGDNLVIYRKDNSNPRGPVYVIYAADFSPGDFVPAPEQTSENVDIDGDELKINLRRQGSVYIYDKSDPNNIVFYQLDSWHESTHPYYWSKDFIFEAEISDDTMKHLIKTERLPIAGRTDYTNFTTYVSFSDAGVTKKQMSFDFEPRNDTQNYYIWVHARSVSGNQNSPSYIKFLLDGNDNFEITGINSKDFQWYCYKRNGKKSFLWAAPDVPHELRIVAGDQFLELDKIILSTTEMPSEINQKEISPNSLK